MPPMKIINHNTSPCRDIKIWHPRKSRTHDPKIQATRNTSYLTASKSLNGRKIARMAPILTIFGPNRSQRRNLFFEKFSNERRRHRGIVVVVIVAVVVAVVGGFWVACIKGMSLLLLVCRMQSTLQMLCTAVAMFSSFIIWGFQENKAHIRIITNRMFSFVLKKETRKKIKTK